MVSEQVHLSSLYDHINKGAKPKLNKCLKCGQPCYRSIDYCPKNLNLVEAKVSETEVNGVKDGDDDEALELEADEGEMSNCIVQKILLALKRIIRAIRFLEHVAPSTIKCII